MRLSETIWESLDSKKPLGTPETHNTQRILVTPESDYCGLETYENQ